MTAQDARAALLALEEDATVTPADAAEYFRALYGRAPDDEDADVLSLCYAALGGPREVVDYQTGETLSGGASAQLAEIPDAEASDGNHTGAVRAHRGCRTFGEWRCCAPSEEDLFRSRGDDVRTVWVRP
jgi:hypothetical protein